MIGIDTCSTVFDLIQKSVLEARRLPLIIYDTEVRFTHGCRGDADPEVASVIERIMIEREICS